MSGSTKEWIRPDELMKIQRKKKKLQERLNHRTVTERPQQPSTDLQNVFTSQKRTNPFAKSSDQSSKKTRPELSTESEETIFELLHNTESKPAPNIEAPIHETPVLENRCDPTEDENDLSSEIEVLKPTKDLPVDWSIKSRLRILSKSLIVSNNLKSNEEASGLTGYVRCLDTKSTSHPLDISNGARFHQNLMYWQYPHLPWLNLIQRNASSNNQFKINPEESESLLKDWMDCFRNLFQLLRTLHCPYFYVLANQFTVLFRAAGIGGRCEMHALLTPTTRGFRQLLKEEDIEFMQPLKSVSKDGSTPNTSSENCEDDDDKESEDDEEDEMKFLKSLGVETSDIKFKDDVKARTKEVEDDNGELSTILIEGADCQAFFSFLLNAKSTVPKIGKLAGIPPTLLSPVAYLGGALRKQSTRFSKLRLEGEDFFSIEVRGAILPHTVHTLCNLLSEIKDNFSLTMVNCPRTVAFTKTSRQLLEDLDSSRAAAGQVFGCENLSECGIVNSILERMCKVDAEAVTILERLQYDLENGGYILF